MDVTGIRRANLEALMEEHQLDRRALAARLGKEVGQVNHWWMKPGRAGRRAIGSQLAREIEASFGKPHGWLDTAHYVRSREEDGAVVVREEPAEFPVRGGTTALDRLDVVASMGSGIDLPEREPVIDSIRVPLDWVRDQFPHATSPKNLKIITGFGDSMLPTFRHGDPLIVDVGVSAMDVDTVYVFAFQNELYVKRIQRLPDHSIRIISDNRAMYDPFVLDMKQREDVHVIARVLCAVNMNKIS